MIWHILADVQHLIAQLLHIGNVGFAHFSTHGHLCLTLHLQTTSRVWVTPTLYTTSIVVVSVIQHNALLQRGRAAKCRRDRRQARWCAGPFSLQHAHIYNKQWISSRWNTSPCSLALSTYARLSATMLDNSGKCQPYLIIVKWKRHYHRTHPAHKMLLLCYHSRTRIA